MLVAIYSDLHAHNYKQFDKDGSRLNNCLEAIKDVYDLCDKSGIGVVLFVGDLFDQQKNLPTVVVNAMARLFKELAKKYPKIICYAITGNHDQAEKSLIHREAASALEHVETMVSTNFIIVDNASARIAEGVIVHGIPYYEYPEHFKQALEERAGRVFREAGTNLLLIHQTPSGIMNGHIATDTNTDDPLYDIFDYVFCGHIHTHQQMTDNFCVVGSPIHRDLGDAGEDKGFLIFDTERLEHKRIILSDKYPKFETRKVAAGEALDFSGESNYIIPEVVLEASTENEGDASAEEFSSSLKAEELVKNYWKSVDGKNKKLLEQGLKLLKK